MKINKIEAGVYGKYFVTDQYGRYLGIRKNNVIFVD